MRHGFHLGRRHFSIAQGSAMECAAALNILRVTGRPMQLNGAALPVQCSKVFFGCERRSLAQLCRVGLQLAGPEDAKQTEDVLLDRGPAHAHRARGRPVDASHQVGQGRLPAAGLPHHGRELSGTALNRA